MWRVFRASFYVEVGYVSKQTRMRQCQQQNNQWQGNQRCRSDKSSQSGQLAARAQYRQCAPPGLGLYHRVRKHHQAFSPHINGFWLA